MNAENPKNPADVINSPPHYTGENGMEAIDVIEAFDLGFNLGNVVKYVLRAGKKGNRTEDMKKAAWYLNREITKKRFGWSWRSFLEKSAPHFTRKITQKGTKPGGESEADSAIAEANRDAQVDQLRAQIKTDGEVISRLRRMLVERDERITSQAKQIAEQTTQAHQSCPPKVSGDFGTSEEGRQREPAMITREQAIQAEAERSIYQDREGFYRSRLGGIGSMKHGCVCGWITTMLAEHIAMTEAAERVRAATEPPASAEPSRLAFRDEEVARLNRVIAEANQQEIALTRMVANQKSTIRELRGKQEDVDEPGVLAVARDYYAGFAKAKAAKTQDTPEEAQHGYCGDEEQRPSGDQEAREEEDARLILRSAIRALQRQAEADKARIKELELEHDAKQRIRQSELDEAYTKGYRDGINRWR